jgi:hypothetical protein
MMTTCSGSCLYSFHNGEWTNPTSNCSSGCDCPPAPVGNFKEGSVFCCFCQPGDGVPPSKKGKGKALAKPFFAAERTITVNLADGDLLIVDQADLPHTCYFTIEEVDAPDRIVCLTAQSGSLELIGSIIRVFMSSGDALFMVPIGAGKSTVQVA